MENIIKLEKNDVLRFKIETSEGKDTGEYLTFDFSDIADVVLKFQEMLEKKEKNTVWLRNQILIIEKRQDVKGKKALSKNQEDIAIAIKKFFAKHEEIYNMFLGENGFKKLTNGRSANWFTIDEVDKIINEQIAPYLDLEIKRMEEKIEEKYKNIMAQKGVI